MLTSDFDYSLPPELIAQHPPAERTAARMLVLDRAGGAIRHRQFVELPEYLRAGDLVVVNDTRVFPARLQGHWADTGGKVELLLVEALDATSMPPRKKGTHVMRWTCLCGSGRRARPGLTALFGGGAIAAQVEATAVETGEVTIVLEGGAPLWSLIERHGQPPLPPYIHRQATPSETEPGEDRTRYQTVYARETGAVAAPTAGLHFTQTVLDDLRQRNVAVAAVTLHVGPGTFKPVQTEQVDAHTMHEERFTIPEATATAIRACRARGGRILAVGSTTVRALETMATEQDGQAVACAGRSRLFIREPYAFGFTDRMLTNFHLPRSTLLMMVSALAGRERVLAAYQAAIAERYRFFSYGDCMLIV